MTTERQQSIMEDLRCAASQLGGRAFLGSLIVSIIFCFGLFVLRADKFLFLPGDVANASAEDLVAFWRASQMALTGEAAAAYDKLAFQGTLVAPNDTLIWWNPPHAFLLIWPLSLAPYGVAKVFWMAGSLSALAGIAKLSRTSALGLVAILISPAAFASLLVLQSGPFIALGLLAAFLMADRRPLLCGLLLAVLTVKPQYGLMAPVFLAAIGAWRAFGAAAAFTAILALISAIIFGVDIWRQFFTAPLGDYLTTALNRDMVAVGHSLQKAGLGGSPAMAAQIATIMGCGAVVWLTSKRAPREIAIGITLLASALAAPSVWIYDWPLVAAGLLMLARSASPWPISLQITAGLAWLGPLYSLGLTTMTSSLVAPIALATTLMLACRTLLKEPVSGQSAA